MGGGKAWRKTVTVGVLRGEWVAERSRDDRLGYWVAQRLVLINLTAGCVSDDRGVTRCAPLDKLVAPAVQALLLVETITPPMCDEDEWRLECAIL